MPHSNQKIFYILFWITFVSECAMEIFSSKFGLYISTITINTGNNYTLSCIGNTTPFWTYPDVPESYKNWTEIIHATTNNNNGSFESTLTIINASYPFTGYYICNFKTPQGETFNSNSTYIFITNNDHLQVPWGHHQLLTAFLYEPFTIPCRSTNPNISVALINHNDQMHYDNFTYNPMDGFIFKNVTHKFGSHYTCKYTYNETIEDTFFVTYVNERLKSLPEPIIAGNKVYYVGDQLSLTCLVYFSRNYHHNLTWSTPNEYLQKNRTNITVPLGRILGIHIVTTRMLIINNLQLEDSGRYVCRVFHNSISNFKYINVTVIEAGNEFINIRFDGKNPLTVLSGTKTITWTVYIDAFPPPNVTLLNNYGKKVQLGYGFKYILLNKTEDEYVLHIMRIELNDNGTYRVIVSNPGATNQFELFLNVTEKPQIYLEKNLLKTPNANHMLECSAEGNPIPQIQWFRALCLNCSYEMINPKYYTNHITNFNVTSQLTVTTNYSGFLKCNASNSLGTEAAVTNVFITGVENGFDLYACSSISFCTKKRGNVQIARKDIFNVSCIISLYKYETKIEWFFNDSKIWNSSRYHIYETTTYQNDRISNLLINVNANDSGPYSCRAETKKKEKQMESIILEVVEPQAPNIKPIHNIEVNFPNKVKLQCKTDVLPKPIVRWYKDSISLEMNDRIHLEDDGQTLILNYTTSEDEGNYKCEARNKYGSDFKNIYLTILNKPSNKPIHPGYLIVIIILITAFCIASIYIFIKRRRERQLQKELKKIGLENFERGAVENLNPDIGITDQADLLPYNRKWEFPAENLILGKQLGSGAFGVVMKAEAKGILKPDETTIVAVKMAKRNSNDMFIKALASELKIMIHLGKHVNVVNLLGACTKNVAKRELLVIVEYCRYGNILHYLLCHRRNFINQIDPDSGCINYNIGLDARNSIEVGNCISVPATPVDSSMSMVKLLEQDEITNSEGQPNRNNCAETDWNINYKGDYKGEIVPHISTKDLLIWSFQVARGMDYLVSRKVLHGDLAARNVLLAENNVVKICDFGLAKTLYQTKKCKKHMNEPMPLKWMAVESIRDGIFSSQSDVWSFGVLLWELFALGQTPYTSMEADERLYNKLIEGYRMQMPKYAPQDIYNIMLDCWQPEPTSRPSFTIIFERIASILEGSVVRHYTNLNEPYLMCNNEAYKNGESDYITKLSSPNYENCWITTKDPNDNENESSAIHNPVFAFDDLDGNSHRPDVLSNNFEEKPSELMLMVSTSDSLDDSGRNISHDPLTLNSISNFSYMIKE